MTGLKEKIEQAVNFIKSAVDLKPEVAIILGTGLGDLSQQIKASKKIPYDQIPFFPKPTVLGHKGELVFGTLSGKKVVAMEGRFHYYEGHSLEEVTFPVRVMKALGAGVLIVSNASGGMNPAFKPGDLVIITDQINFMGVNPLIGPNDESLGSRFPDMSEPYNRGLIQVAEKVAGEKKLKVQKGVYIGVTGPNLETAAEYRFMHQIGADIVGMSTVPEVIVAVHSGLKVLGISCVTDSCDPDNLKPADIKEILKIAAEAEPKLTKLVSKVVEKI